MQIETNDLFKLMRRKEADFSGTLIAYNQFEGMVLNAVNEFGNRLNQACRNFPDYTLHDEDHAYRVCTLMYRLLSDDARNRLNVIELGLLVISAFGHDIGMAVARSERENLETTGEYKDFVLE